MIVLILLVIMFLILSIPSYRKIIKQKKRESLLKYQFPIWVRHVHCLLQNHTVYWALKHSESQVPFLLRESYDELIQHLEQYPESYAGYLQLIERHSSHEVQRMMQALFRYQKLDKGKAQSELYMMMVRGSQWLEKVRKEKMNLLINTSEMMGLLPLFATGVFLVVQMGSMMVEMIQSGWSI